MKGFLEEFYYGGIHPSERPPSLAPEAIRCQEQCRELEKRISEYIPEECSSLIDDYYAACGEEMCVNEKDAFLEGMKLGAKMVCELLL